MDEMNIPSIILLALIVIALVLVIIHIIRNGGCSGDCSACKSCNNCNNCSNCKKAEKAKVKHILKGRAEALPQSVEKVKQRCLAFSLICGIINMVMKCAENRKIRTTSDRICMYGLAC